ncbi:hypothetical protein ACP70R_020703 [Stipagrostis hirtigluma subsp. patula]
MAPPTTSPLHNVTDGDRWNADHLFGRLCTVAHAAFLHCGFLPADDSPAGTPWSSLSRRYSLPQLGQGAPPPVVLHLSWEGRPSDDMALKAYYLTPPDDGWVRLGSAAVAAALSGGLDETAFTLTAPGSAGQWLWKLLADGICHELFLHVRRLNV